MSLKTQANSIPKEKNMVVIECGECGKNKTFVKVTDHVVNFTCPFCYQGG